MCTAALKKTPEVDTTMCLARDASLNLRSSESPKSSRKLCNVSEDPASSASCRHSRGRFPVSKPITRCEQSSVILAASISCVRPEKVCRLRFASAHMDTVSLQAAAPRTAMLRSNQYADGFFMFTRNVNTLRHDVDVHAETVGFHFFCRFVTQIRFVTAFEILAPGTGFSPFLGPSDCPSEHACCTAKNGSIRSIN
jgi:hypothetical protein